MYSRILLTCIAVIGSSLRTDSEYRIIYAHCLEVLDLMIFTKLLNLKNLIKIVMQ